ncbi:probable methyltransferase-like protein 25 isoform X2 [Gopherus flavomarginatus]|uniref:probable methyltransferase-like protein 25 isoform X2 n=1 Tax=Gopherus flavomarginatus TaxID=286002 RepID=UPI0021CC01D0|nr:probable methyltransferase-like protein 25 isoform X2 [Gopherus flavomarginatus]
MSRSLGSLPPEPAAETVASRLRAVAQFLRRALPLCQAHTVEFYTRGLWEQLVALSPETVLEALSGAGLLRQQQRPLEEAASTARPGLWDNCKFSNVFCENSQKLVNVQFFALAAKYHSLPSLEVCTPLDQMLGALSGKQHERCEIKTEKFMNDKKSHEVEMMSKLIDSIANFCGIKQVIDLGSGKGYLSSFLSMQYNLKVYGIDSSNTNTYGANERNRKLKKHWRAYQSRAKANVRGQVLEEPKDRAVQDEVKCRANINEKLLSTNNSLLSQDQMASSDSVPLEITGAFIDSAMLKTSKQTETHLMAQTQSDGNKMSENAFSLLNILPADAVEAVSSSKYNLKLCEEEKEQRKMASIKAKASKSNDSNIYLPLTSYITAETELRDIITDLEDCIMVGLHTCGDLAPNTLRIFTAKPEIKAVCSVGCCYHLLTEEFENQKAAHFSSLPTSVRRLAQIRRRKKRTRDEMFTEIMAVTRNERAHLGEWKDVVATYRKDASEREDRRDQREDRRDARDEMWRQEDQKCRQEDQRWRDATLELLRDQTDILQSLVEELRGHRVPLQPMFNLPQYSPCSISSTPRRVRTRGGRLSAPAHSTPVDSPTKRLSLH